MSKAVIVDKEPVTDKPPAISAMNGNLAPTALEEVDDPEQFEFRAVPARRVTRMKFRVHRVAAASPMPYDLSDQE